MESNIKDPQHQVERPPQDATTKTLASDLSTAAQETQNMYEFVLKEINEENIVCIEEQNNFLRMKEQVTVSA